jgi:hypothetical protein
MYSEPVCHELKLIRLACLIHAASVHPEPGSNSQKRSMLVTSAMTSQYTEQLIKNKLLTEKRIDQVS